MAASEGTEAAIARDLGVAAKAAAGVLRGRALPKTLALRRVCE